MSHQRRNVIRAQPVEQDRKRQCIQAKLTKSETALARWQKRLQRACAAVLKHQKQVTRLHRQLRQTQH